ncbi:hypothetical protein BC332_34046 [Capsicum chinense]|nr:hypothetical protein BC332_34046 [Capsicum chinense]
MKGNDKPTVRFTSIYIFVSLVEECPEAALKYCDVFLPLLLDETIDEDPMVRQYALYGVCLYAESGGSVFKPFVREALSRINVVLMHFRADEPVNEEAYDKAVSALCKICLLHRESIDSAQSASLLVRDTVAKVSMQHMFVDLRGMRPSKDATGTTWTCFNLGISQMAIGSVVPLPTVITSNTSRFERFDIHDGINSR